MVYPVQVGEVRGSWEHTWGWSESIVCVLSGVSVRIAPQLHPKRCHSERAFRRLRINSTSEESRIYMNLEAVTGESNPESNESRRSRLVYSPF